MQPAHLFSSAIVHPDFSRRSPSTPPEINPRLPRWKRGLDLACCVAALPVLGGTTILAGLVTSISSPGPLFFREPVTGADGRSFGMYRLRTMHVRRNPSEQTNRAATPPFFPGGRLLQRSGLAKLPQIINVLRGEMTIVGTRPVAVARAEQSAQVSQTPLGLRPGIISSERGSAKAA